MGEAKQEMRRSRIGDLIIAAWEMSNISWPPLVGSKVRIWWRVRGTCGRIATVVANETAIMIGYKSVKPGTGKIRIKCGELVALVSITDVFPANLSRKDIKWIDLKDHAGSRTVGSSNLTLLHTTQEKSG